MVYLSGANVRERADHGSLTTGNHVDICPRTGLEEAVLRVELVQRARLSLQLAKDVVELSHHVVERFQDLLRCRS